MTQEREPTPIERRLAKTETAIAKVEAIRGATRPFILAKLGEDLAEGKMSSDTYLEKAALSGERAERIQRGIDESTLPGLNSLRAELQSETEFDQRLSIAEARFGAIKTDFEAGNIPEHFFRQAEEALNSIRASRQVGRESPVEAEARQAPQPPVEPKAEAPSPSEERIVESEKEPVVHLSVDWRNRRINFDGREIAIRRGQVDWTVFMVLAKNAHAGVDSDLLTSAAQRVGSLSESAGRDSVDHLRDLFEEDSSNPKLILTTRTGRGGARYTLEADVEFVGDKPKLEVSRSNNLIVYEGQEIELSDNQMRALRVLAGSVDSEVFSRDLSNEALGNPNTQETRINQIVRQLKRILNRDNVPDVVFSSGQAAQNSWSALKGVDVVTIGKDDGAVESEQPAISTRTKSVDFRAENESREYVLPDGRRITVKGPLMIKFFEQLINTSEQEYLTVKGLEEEIYGEHSDIMTWRVFRTISTINQNMLRPIGWEFFQSVPTTELRKGEKGRYYLRKSGQITGEDGAKVAELTLRNLEIVEGMVAEGLLPQSALDEYRARLGEKQPEETETPVRRPRAREFESKGFVLPDGAQIQLKGEMRIQTFELVSNTNVSNPVLIADMAIEIYGEDTEVTRGRIGANVSVINKLIINKVGWEIHQPVLRSDLNKGEKGKYYLRKIGEEAAEAEVDSGTGKPIEDGKDETSTDLSKLGQPADGKGGDAISGRSVQPEEPSLTQATVPQRLIEVPYEPLPEEIRTKEEDLVLRTIIDYRTSHSRFNFEAIQIALASLIEERKATDLEGTHFRIYRAYELKELYRSAMSKLSKDIAAGKSGASLPDDDKILWTKAEALAERLTSNRQDMTRLNQVLSGEIDSAEREFYDLNPDLRGKDWILK